jgi:hypothetical protein
LLSFGGSAEAAAPVVPLTKIGNPSWKPVDFQLFSAPATPFFETFGNVYNNLLPYDTPLASTYVPHPGPYDTELSENAAAAGYVSHTLFPPEALTLDPNGLYIGFMLVPDPGTIGSSRDFASGPVIPNSVFPIASNGDIWLDDVLVDRLLGADFFQSVGSRDADKVGTSHLEFLQAIWHPWDDDLTVGPLGRYDFRLSIRDNSGAGWDGHMRFRVAIPGDYDYSGTVGPEDHAVWKTNFGSTTNLDADGNDDHIVDAADYTIWRNNFGTSYSGSGSIANLATQSPAVPEPSMPVFICLAVLSGFFLTSRSGR